MALVKWLALFLVAVGGDCFFLWLMLFAFSRGKSPESYAMSFLLLCFELTMVATLYSIWRAIAPFQRRFLRQRPGPILSVRKAAPGTGRTGAFRRRAS